MRGGRVVDLAGGHGLLAQTMLLLDDSSPSALVVDPAIPPSASRSTPRSSPTGLGSPSAMSFVTASMDDVVAQQPTMSSCRATRAAR